MNTKELMIVLDEILRCWKLCNMLESPVLQEVSMWRKKYLDSQAVSVEEEDQKTFLATPCEQLVKSSPEVILYNLVKPKEE